MRRVFGLRFAAEAGAIVGVAVLVWYERLSRLEIVAAMAVTWLVVAVVEWWIGRRTEAPEPGLPPELELALYGGEAEPTPEPEPEPEPAPVAQTAAAPLDRPAAPQEWNVWDLERLAREGAGEDAGRDEERAFLLLYLRDFAGPDGLLPAHFDSLVRDSFGDLIAGSRR